MNGQYANNQIKNDQSANDSFVNCYNFIPLPSQKAKKYNDTDKHTGYIEYTLTTRTPLFIPNTSNDNFFKMGFEHKSYDFFSYTDVSQELNSNKCHEPVIPGSEVRGMIRSIYETLTDSCLSVLNNNQDLSKRVKDIFMPGLLRKKGDDTYVLYSAKSYAAIGKNGFQEKLNKQIYDFSEGAKVTIEPEEGMQYFNNIQNEGLSKTGYVLIGENGARKKSKIHVYVLASQIIGKFTKNEVKRLLVGTIDSYQLQTPGAYEKYKKALLAFMNGEGEEYFPVNYRTVGENVYLSCSRISREISQYKVKDFVREFNPCGTKEDICPACDLFGNVQNDWAKTSKLRFEDLKILNKKTNNNEYYNSVVTLPILGSPKMSNTAFYFKKPSPSAVYWTFDYYRDGNNNTKNCFGEIQGRKYYWHHQPNLGSFHEEPGNMNKTIRPLRKGITFKGKLFFEGISMKQIEQMEMILDGFNGACSYKLGAGKPLGLGSVLLEVKNIKERITKENNQICYKEIDLPLTGKTYEELGFSTEVEAGFMLICDFDATKGKEVSYPLKNSYDPGFKWYLSTLNKMSGFVQPLKPLNGSIHDTNDLLLSKEKGLYGPNQGSSKKNKNGNSNKNSNRRNRRPSY